MPFIVPKATADIAAQGASLGLLGPDFTRLASAVALTCASQFSLPGTMLVTASGAAGAGAAFGSPPTGVTPPAMAALMMTGMATRGLLGPQLFSLTQALSAGICLNLGTMLLTGVSPGVGTGVGVAKAVAFNPSLFGSVLLTNMISLGMLGADTIRLSSALAEGICLSLNASLIIPVVTITGPAGPAPAATVFPAMLV